MQSALEYPKHIAIILDGNGRWAEKKGWPRIMGHRAGARRVKEITEAAPGLGIATLSLYAFSADNWKRPSYEVSGLMRLFREYLCAETLNCLKNGVRLSIMGRRDRLSDSLVQMIHHAEAQTLDGKNLHLRIALDYSAREMLQAAMETLAHHQLPFSRENISRCLSQAGQLEEPVPDVDLLIRTGGEQRLSDFLLWESAYAELIFLEKMWPDFGKDDLAVALAEYGKRQRRFGGLALPQAV